MAFPTTGILDAFTRADGAIGGSWVTPFFGDTAPTIVSNQVKAPVLGGWAGARYNAATYGADCETYITAVDNPGLSRILHVRVSGTDASPNGYTLSADNTAFCKVSRNDAGVATKLGADFSITALPTGSAVGIERVSTKFSIYLTPSRG